MPKDVLENCPVCQRNLEKGSSNYDMEFGTYEIKCITCGRFKCTVESDDVLPRLSPADRARLSGVIRERNELNIATSLLLSSDNIGVFLASAPPTFDVPAKVRKFLSMIARHSKSPGDHYTFIPERDFAIGYAADAREIWYLMSYAERMGWILRHDPDTGQSCQLTPEGWEQVRIRQRFDSSQCFVAMAFADDMRPIYDNAIYPAVHDGCHFKCIRIDAKEYNGGIVDEIKAEIRQSRFVVSELTWQRQGVYYEAGFADGLGIPVIWTCRKDDLANVHFDSKHLNLICWTSLEDLRKKLKNRILATIGVGPLAPRE